MAKSPYIITISSEKGGVGKTTIALNLAIYIKYLYHEVFGKDCPVTLFSFDNHFSVDRMLQIGRNKPQGSIADVLSGASNFDELAAMGQYGVQYIPSCANLAIMRDSVKNVEALSRAISSSNIGGVVIIDTRPDLDILTQNAIFASDKTLIPVKDEASLSNSRHIFQFCAEHNVPKKNVMVLPSLLDSRIRFDGAFQTPFHLIRAYAMHRGYPCYEGFISKSPKVETLNTNPEGRIYPIIKHGRMTEVHIQLTDLGKSIIREAEELSIRRTDQFKIQSENKKAVLRSQFNDRLSRVNRECPICQKAIKTGIPSLEVPLFIWSTEDGQIGFVHEECLVQAMIRGHFAPSRKDVELPSAFMEMSRETLRGSFFGFNPRKTDGTVAITDIARFSLEGLEISRTTTEVRMFDNGLLRKESDLYRLLLRTSGQSIAVAAVTTELPEGMLYGERFVKLNDICSRVLSHIASPAKLNIAS